MKKQDLNGYRTPLDVARRYKLGDIALNSQEIEELAAKIVTDSALSITSENPVQNKVVTAALNGKASVASLQGKQDTLVSGTNIKTINSTSLLGSENIEVQTPLVSGTSIKTINETSLLGSGDISVQPTLESGTNIKTINSSSILGSGDLMVTEAKNIITAYISSNYSITTTHSYIKIPLIEYVKIGSKLSMNNSNQIVVGSGVSHVKISFNVRAATNATSDDRYCRLYISNSGKIRLNITGQDDRIVINATPAIFSVQQNDVIDLRYYGQNGDALGGSSDLQTYLTVEVID